MDRARRAALTALIVVVMIATAGGPGGWRRATRACRRRRLADVDARAVRGPDGRRIGVRRVRRDRQPGGRADRPARAGGGLCDLVGLDRDAQGDLGQLPDPRAGPAFPAGQRFGRLRGDGRRHLHRRRRRDGRRDGASGRGRRGRGCRWLGRRDERIRGRRRRTGATGWLEPRARSGWFAREHDRFQRQRRRLVRPGGALAAGPGRTARSGTRPEPNADAGRHAKADAPTPPDADARTDATAADTARPSRRRPGTPDPAHTTTPPPTPT